MQVFRVFVVLPLLGLPFLRSVVLVIGPQHSHLLMNISNVVEVIELSKPQLAVVVIKALLGYSYNASSFQQSKPFPFPFPSQKVDVSPPFDHFQSLADGPLPTFLLLLTSLEFALAPRAIRVFSPSC